MQTLLLLPPPPPSTRAHIHIVAGWRAFRSVSADVSATGSTGPINGSDMVARTRRKMHRTHTHTHTSEKNGLK